MNIVLPPGSVSHPFEKAPSGNILLVVDDYDRLEEPKRGGLTEEPLHLLSHSQSASSNAPVGAAEGAAPEEARAEEGHQPGGSCFLASARSRQLER